ncbi:receptor-type tyrosine-protein phosphatase delta-like [Lethenteron reissneri]|uniref:receptor-type tyrosine-protein phosphatase delta-like n=1 Tax=Lethenteron reissneri TaxID=7753 RepID=UPI002AB720EC|nr:receptor-type tyrosine-protein phosphatase delta-like [Lethenteron reissneri]
MTETTSTSVTLTWDLLGPDPVLFYIIQYKLQSSEGPFRETDAVPDTRHTLAGLEPDSMYELRVLAVNGMGRGPPSPPALARTGEQAPSGPPRNVHAYMLGRTPILLIAWRQPKVPNGVIRGYRVYCAVEPVRPESTWLESVVGGDDFFALLGGLAPNTPHVLRVLAFTSAGDGPLSDKIYVETTVAAPVQPVKLTAEAVSESSILLRWTPPHHGAVASYELYVRHGGDNNNDNNKNKEEEEVVTLEPSAVTFLLERLQPDTVYRFQLSARSRAGLGPATFTVTERTKQSAPSAPPQNTSCVSLSPGSVLVSWEPPPAHGRHGTITGYTVAYRELPPGQGTAHAPDADGSGRGDDGKDGEAGEDGSEGQPSWVGGWRQTPLQPAERRSVTLRGLSERAPYEVTVRAHTAVSPGPPSLPVQARALKDAATTTATTTTSRPSSAVSTGDEATLPAGGGSASISFMAAIAVLAILPFVVCTAWGTRSAGKRGDERGGNAPNLLPEKDTVSDCSGYVSNVLAGVRHDDGGDDGDDVTVGMMELLHVEEVVEVVEGEEIAFIGATDTEPPAAE